MEGKGEEKQKVVERVALRVALEAFPLREASIPPCRLRAIALSKGTKGGHLLVYLGTDTGELLVYKITDSPLSHVNDVQSRANAEDRACNIFLTTHKSISRSPVEALCVVSEVGRIAILSDDLVALVDFATLGSLEVLPVTKGASAIARFYQHATGREKALDDIFPAVENGTDVLKNHADASRPDQILSEKSSYSASLSSKFGDIRGAFGFSKLGGSGGAVDKAGVTGSPGGTCARFAVAVKKKLLLYEVYPARKERKQKAFARLVKEMVGSEGVVTLAWLDNVIFAGSVREYTLFSLSSGQATPLFSLPQDLARPPLLKPLPQANEILLMVDTLAIFVNTEGVPRTGSVLFSAVPDAVAFSPPFVVAATRGQVELYHRKTGKKIQTVLTDVAKGPYMLADNEDGSFLVVANGSKIWCLQQATVDDQVKELLKQKEFNEAVQVANECVESGSGDNAMARLGIVHAEAGFLLLFDLCFAEAINHFLESNVLQPLELFPFFPTLTTRWRSFIPRKRYWGLHPPPQPIEKVIDTGLQELQSGLFGQAAIHAESSVNDRGLVSAKKEELLALATKSFIRYFSNVREKLTISGEKEGVDTLLMKLYIQLGASNELRQLAHSTNSCLLEEVEGLLKGSGHLQALALLYENKGQVMSSLQIWQSLAQGDILLAGPQPLKSSGDSVHSLFRMEAAAQAARLLEGCNDGDLVLHHISWILEMSEDLALSVLTSSRREEPLMPEKVLALLRGGGGSLRQRYLQWLVQEQGSKESHHHTELALCLVRDAAKRLKIGSGDAASLRQTLQSFLEVSDKYEAEVVLNDIQDSQLWHEQVILHQRLGDEMSALRILALHLEDYEAAERYCNKLGRPDAYVQLLEIYLNPGSGKEPMHRAAVGLLHRHGLILDPLRILEALPSDMPLSSASQTIRCMLRARVHWHLQGQLMRHLVRAGNLEARIERVGELSRHVQITVESTCGSCHAKIGTKPFGFHPNGTVVCYKCLRLQGVR